MAERTIIQVVATYYREWPARGPDGDIHGTETYLNEVLVLFSDGAYEQIHVPTTLKAALDALMAREREGVTGQDIAETMPEGNHG